MNVTIVKGTFKSDSILVISDDDVNDINDKF